MQALLELPENWHVVVTEENKEVLSNWLYSHYESVRLEDRSLIFEVVYKDKGKPMQGTIKDNSTEISTADFKRLVLGEKNFEDYGVIGGKELEEYFKIGGDVMGTFDTLIYFFNIKRYTLMGVFWDWEKLNDTNLQSLPLSEYLKLLPTETGLTEPEVIETEVKIKKTWETIYFETKNASIELTLNHDEKTFNLSTKYEDNVSFKKDTIESAKEKLKCIEYALNYVEQNLNKK